MSEGETGRDEHLRPRPAEPGGPVLGAGRDGGRGSAVRTGGGDRAALARLDGVGLRYDGGPEILQAISLDLEAGSFHFLVGPSGAGKTSLLRVLCLALRASSGRVRLFGVDIAHSTRAELALLRRRIGVVYQDFRLLPQLSLFDNVALPLRIAGTDEAAVRQDVGRMLERMGLQQQRDVLPTRLSGGEQQLVAIARALIVRPLFLVADEPTASVDERSALRLVHLFQELNRLGATVLVATHNQTLAERFRQPRLRLQGGHLRREGPGTAPLSHRESHRDSAAPEVA